MKLTQALKELDRKDVDEAIEVGVEHEPDVDWVAEDLVLNVPNHGPKAARELILHVFAFCIDMGIDIEDWTGVREDERYRQFARRDRSNRRRVELRTRPY